MSCFIESINAGALALREVRMKYNNMPKEVASPIHLSKSAPYFGFIDIIIDDCPPFVMFSCNDDFVAKNFFWNGADAYEPMSLRLWLRLARESSVIFDIGAYTGIYSLSAASLNRKSKVFAFEALDTVYGRLHINKSSNNFGNIELRHVALAEKEGEAEFSVYSGDSVLSTGSSLVGKQAGRPVFQKKRVSTISLDGILADSNISRLDLLKIDAEGAEYLIFEGGRKAFQKYKPDIICEFLKESRASEIEIMLSGMGYRYFHINERTMRVDPVEGIAVAEDMDSLNTLITCKSVDQIQSMLK